jgi:hypothetical protein
MAMTDPYVKSKQKRYKSTPAHLEANRAYRAKNREILNEKAKARMRRNSIPECEQLELIPTRRRSAPCTCGDFHNCLKCRTAERKRRAKSENPDVLKSVMKTLSPDVLAICLEVRAQNSRKHQPAARAGAGD